MNKENPVDDFLLNIQIVDAYGSHIRFIVWTYYALSMPDLVLVIL